LGGLFEIDALIDRLNVLEKEMNEDNFWEDFDNASNINKEYTNKEIETTRKL